MKKELYLAESVCLVVLQYLGGQIQILLDNENCCVIMWARNVGTIASAHLP